MRRDGGEGRGGWLLADAGAGAGGSWRGREGGEEEL